MTLIKNDEINQYIFLLNTCEYLSSEHNIIISSNIYSSVSVCIFDNEKKIGGMNNFLMPYDFNPEKIYSRETRIGIHIIDMLINEVLKKGGKRKNLRAKIFGSSNDTINNFYFAKKYLEIEEIDIVSEKIGNNIGIKIFFYPVGGKVLLKKIYDKNTIEKIKEKENKDFFEFEKNFSERKDFIDFETF